MTVIALAREKLKDPRGLFMVNDHALEIALESKTLDRDARGFLTHKGRMKLFSSPHAQSTMQWLFEMAHTSPRQLRDLGQAIINAQKRGCVDLVTDDPSALELVNAYEWCTARPPTIAEVEEIFIARGKAGKHDFPWRGGFYARRALLSRGLRTLPAKRGRRTGWRKTKK